MEQTINSYILWSMPSAPETIYERLIERCRREGFAGYDPFDGLESSIIKALPLKHSRVFRFGWLQIVKRFPVDLRPLLLVSKGVNPKGLALFCLAEMSRYRVDPSDNRKSNALALAANLLKIATPLQGGRALAYGYNFDWQSSIFYAPKGTPTIVPTAFAARSFLSVYREFGMEEHLDALRKISAFVETSLNRVVDNEREICFSYTPLDRSAIYNASLLAAETIANVAHLDGRSDLADLAERASRFVISGQKTDGSWEYGPGEKHSWIDNFHTAYILNSLLRISDNIASVREAAHGAIDRGFEFWSKHHFLADGTPKYYHDRVYPIDIHSAAVAIVTLSELSNRFDSALPLARKVLGWTLENLFDGTDSFYYQKRRRHTFKTPFMRWGQAWMAYALARSIEAERAIGNGSVHTSKT